MAIFKCGGQWILDDDGNKSCEHEAERTWRGQRCPSCGTYRDPRRVGALVSKDKQKRMTSADYADAPGYEFISTGISEVDRVLCGGIVLGKAYLIGGERGSGKSTLLQMICDNVTSTLKRNALYASGEEAGNSVGMLAQRLGIKNSRFHILGNEAQEANDIDTVLQRCKELRAGLLILDSIQTTTIGDSKGNEGSGAQVNAVMNVLNAHCTEHEMAVFVVSHLEKGGNYAGTETLQHLVDVLLRMDKHLDFDDEGELKEGEPVRVFECFEKNRLGMAGGKAYFEMTDKGLRPVTKSKLLRLVT